MLTIITDIEVTPHGSLGFSVTSPPFWVQTSESSSGDGSASTVYAVSDLLVDFEASSNIPQQRQQTDLCFNAARLPLPQGPVADHWALSWRDTAADNSDTSVEEYAEASDYEEW